MSPRPLRAGKAIGCLALSLVFILGLTLHAFAQDAGQVLRLFVGYNALKNSVPMSAEKRAEVDRLGQLAGQASAARNFSVAAKHYYHAIALMNGLEWTPSRALSASLTMKIDRAVMEPSQGVRITLGQLFPLDEKPAGKLALKLLLLPARGNDPLQVIKTVNAVDPDFSAHPMSIEGTIPEVADGNYRLSIRLESPAVEPPASGNGDRTAGPEAVTKAVSIHVERGLAAKVSALNERASRLAEKLRASKQAALLDELPSVRYHIELIGLATKGEVSADRVNFASELEEAGTLIDSLEAGRDPFALRRGDFKKAYLSAIDSTLQPYRIFVPSSYDGSKAYPLIIALHGMGGDENSYFDLYAQGAFKTEAEKRGYLVACPKGRQPASMYRGDAEQDVLDVIAEVGRAYKIDPNRIYMTGHSMGGYGTWSVAMDHPDLFAAIAPISGGGNPADMPKLAHIPQLVVHGDNDKTVPVERSREMVEAARKLGAEVKYIEVPGKGHLEVPVPTFPDVYDWFDAHRKKSETQKAATASPSH